MTNRDQRGRFLCGNQISRLGWAGLVNRRFGGNEATAKGWLAQVGRWAYAKQFAGNQTSMMQMRFASAYAHPGEPEQYRQRFEFSLNDVQPMAF